ncbi:MAG: DNA-directed RNA polymerase subunit omega [Candidatus Omnitrophica bacterium CG11_big_fil_rev_8_21_14_0_20_45_26]|uniref:DNA-directed RNA polymerase subunit omega n=1 Tax=Candidatus Abzuiibacterium crystallinum TaxID=1974748 RepID=A0A2H0LMD7_9BACT|nr:MAG: DNA-directed RNA polymerase subunit omega [Candidatus Omnitrophica bacterium CG11_big_fil_rev_8_21_14_0_20_45_26]PIW65130.1 MAG: DNA-directed RNA polymerase subunit omega [Candidatus Omnitrophica bacterium CG12_big_fil_rev_8_21_14_0_65_45_16]
MSLLLENLVSQTNSIYGLVLSAAARANELISGEQPLIQTKSKKISTIVLEEIAKGKIHFEVPNLPGRKT